MTDLQRAERLARIFQAAAHGEPAHTVMYATAMLIAHGIKHNTKAGDTEGAFYALRQAVDFELSE